MTTMKNTAYRLACVAILSTGLAACTETTDNGTVTPTSPKDYVVLTGEFVSPFAGYFTAYGETLPSGSISNVKPTSKQSLGALGMRAVGKYFYKVSNFQDEPGIQKMSVTATGEIKDEGFIATGSAISGSGQHLVADEATGFYFDGDRGTLKIQKFNPGTMQRTGEIDLTTSLSNAKIGYVSVGQNILMAKEGKLFANIHYGTATNKGFLDAVDDTVRLAVIDIAGGKLDKVIKYKAGSPQQVGWFTDNPMWDLGDDGNLYFCALGTVAGGASKILRIKKGETEIDNAWKLEMNDYRKDGTFVNVIVKGGKLYTRIPSEGIKPDFSNLYTDIWKPTAIDLVTKAATPIAGTPLSDFKGNSLALDEIDGKVYYIITNAAEKINGVYEVSGTSATQLFNVTQGGSLSGFVKVQ